MGVGPGLDLEKGRVVTSPPSASEGVAVEKSVRGEVQEVEDRVEEVLRRLKYE